MVLYLHLWFHEEHLTSIEPLHSTNVSYNGKKSYLDYYNALHTKQLSTSLQKLQFVTFVLDVKGSSCNHQCQLRTFIFSK